ncbi:NECA3 protein, partial [Alopecoenas beccarii]|nr:NECA3 protein [Alopecoenas beccarii]
MACAELLAVCLLSADRGPAPRRQPLPIFHDVSTADDGKLSFEEFKNYFADGILSSEELWELFSGIDRRHSDSLQTTCLGTLFLGASLITWVLCSRAKARAVPQSSVIPFPSPQSYETSSKMEQFLTRFLLRETMHQLQSLQDSLECAVDTVEEQAGRERKDIKKSETSVGLRSGRRCGRRGQKNVCLSPTDPYSGMLTTGTHSPVSLGLVSVPRWRGCGSSSRGQGDVSGRVWTVPSNPRHSGILRGSRSALCSGADVAVPPRQAVSQGHCCPRSVSACKLTDEACFILYEFWQDVTSWRSHLQSSCSKTFQRSIVSLLESPELLTTMLFPASWWIMNNN